MTAAALRATVYAEVKDALAKPPSHERYYVLLRSLHDQDPERIPVKPDGRRISTEEALRRLAMRKDSQGVTS
jgi:hypothetical protein